ncbi:MAG: class II fructose-bisphosphate aldolase [Kiritimatiellaeota bacterium]|nr:class II fructose-bisphosphate aldolase [Kiritimatiellota bacterium]
MTSADLVRRAEEFGLVIPAFNIPYLPMMQAVVRAVRDADAAALIAVARLEWIKFEAGGLEAVKREFDRTGDPAHVRLHLDHVPVVDEDGRRVDYLSVIRRALDLGYGSVMVDGSRLPLPENIACTRQAVEAAHAAGVACEAELGAVLGHEAGPLPPYEELFRSGKGFTDVDEAIRFVRETGCDWLSVAVGNIHGAISPAKKDRKKVAARLDLDHVARLAETTGVPLVLHGGSGVIREYLLEAIRNGIAKVNVGTDIRQPYEQTLARTGSKSEACEAVYRKTRWILEEHLGVAGTRSRLWGAGPT